MVAHSDTMSIEDFPAEIKILVLSSMNDYESLKSLVQTSKGYRQAYLKAQGDILHHVAVSALYEVGMAVFEPWSTIRAPRLAVTVPNRVETINTFLDDYGEGQEDEHLRLDVKTSLQILNLHRMFTSIVEDFCQMTISRNPLNACEESHLGSGRHTSVVPRPSHAELSRLHRAIWRWELYSRLFGRETDTNPINPDQHTSGVETQPLHDQYEIATEFLGVFPIHEVEEIASLHSYAKHKIEGYGYRNIADSVPTLGPTFIYAVIVATPEQIHYDIAHCMPIRRDTQTDMMPTLRDSLHEYEWVVSAGQGWPRRSAANMLSVRSEPTKGWLWATPRGAENTDYKLRRWGYVFWDTARLAEWGVKQQHMLNWPWPKEARG